MMADTNPYEVPATAVAEEAAPEIRRPPFGTVLVVVWILEATFKTYCVGWALSQGFNPLPHLAEEYHATSRLVFFLASSFFIIETIGPWIGIYYLTGRRARTIPFNQALVRTLKLAGGLTIIASLTLMFYFELIALAR